MEMMQAISSVTDIHLGESEGDILVFMPGQEEASRDGVRESLLTSPAGRR